MKKRNFIRNLSNCGVGLFLVTGLSGCNNARQEMCRDVSKLSQKQLEECTGKQSSGSSSYVFIANSSSSAKSSGYFSSTSGSLSSGG